MIRTALDQRPPGPLTTLTRVLRRPWCWPAEPELAGRASQLVEQPEGPLPGHTVAVTLTPQTLWEIGPRLRTRATYGGTAADIAWRAERVALAALPLTPRVDLLRSTVRMGLRAIVGRPPAAVDGGSHGLALALAHASHRLDVPIPTDLVAIAAIDERGQVEPVLGLPEKLAVLEEEALAVGRVLVHPDQVGEVSDRFEAIGVTSVREAVQYTFPDAARQLREHLEAHPGHAAELAEQLRRIVLSNTSHVVHWRMVAETARCILGVSLDEASREDAELAEAIAERHEGTSAGFPRAFDSPRLASEREPRLQLMAHWVQSFADGRADEPARSAAREAIVEVAKVGHRTRGDAVLLGAIGRAWASAGDLELARDALQQAVALWMASGLEDQASRAVCELLRVTALMADDEGLDEALEWSDRVSAHLDTSRVSQAFLTHARVRALALRDRIDEAEDRLASLGSPDPSTLPAHLFGGLLRWQARLLDARGASREADEVRSGIDDPQSRAFAGLDRARRDGDDAEAAVAAFRAQVEETAEIDRLLARRPSDEAVLDWITDHYRY